MTPHLDDPKVDVPPPPYSETDIYSNSAGHSPILGQSQTLPIRQRTASHHSLNAVPFGDDASSAASNSEVIYTPPLTPNSSYSNVQPYQSQSQNQSPNPAGSYDGFLSPVYPNNVQNCVSVAPDHLTSASAEAYFESRPVAAGVESSWEARHVITIRPGSLPVEFPFQQEWASRDVRPDDWQTFLNYLLPNHVAESNEALIDKKLRAEGIENDEQARSTRSEKDDRIPSYASPVVAQLEQIRLEERPGQNMNATIREWNEGFFEPRGMRVQVEQAFSTPGEPHIPDYRDRPFNTNPGPDQQSASSSGWWRSLPRFESSNGAFRFGGVSIDNDRTSIGDSFVVDSRGLRIGGLVADDRGLSLHGRDLFMGTSPQAREQAPAQPAPPAPPRSYNPPSMPPMPAMPMAPGHSFPHPTDYTAFEQYNHLETHDAKSSEDDQEPQYHQHHQHHDALRGRGRGYPRQGNPARHRSLSSASSSSSSSSSSFESDSSIGSLPDYDDLKDSQIPVVRSYIKDWLSHPDNAVSKATLKEAKENIKTAKQSETSVAISPAERKEVRAMMGQWARVNRQQKMTRRQLRRERRALRRAEKRARRQTRREARQARREWKREGREARREARRETRGGPRGHHRGGGCHNRGFGPAHPHHGPAFGLRHHSFGGHGSFGGQGPFSSNHQGFPGANFGPDGQRGGAFPSDGRRGGAFQPPVARGVWSLMERWGPRNASEKGPHEWLQKLPGAWPSDADVTGQREQDKERSSQETGKRGNQSSATDPHAVSERMYRELEAKTAIVRGKRDELSAFTGDQAPAETNEMGELDEKPGASTLVGLLAELEELERAVNTLAIDADEQYAKELVMFENSREHRE